MRLKLSKMNWFSAWRTSRFSLGLNPVKTLLILGEVSQDQILPKTLNVVLGESCPCGVVRRKYNLLNPP